MASAGRAIARSKERWRDNLIACLFQSVCNPLQPKVLRILNAIRYKILNRVQFRSGADLAVFSSPLADLHRATGGDRRGVFGIRNRSARPPILRIPTSRAFSRSKLRSQRCLPEAHDPIPPEWTCGPGPDRGNCAGFTLCSSPKTFVSTHSGKKNRSGSERACPRFRLSK